MSDDFTYKGEALLYSWSDSAAGRKVTFLLPDDGGDHPFKGYKSGPKYGQAFALICKPVDYDNPEPAKPGDPVKSVAGYAKPPMTESQRCGMLCADREFQRWLKMTHTAYWEFQATQGRPHDEVAAGTVRHLLNIQSRAELDCGIPARDEWVAMRTQFEADTGRMAERTR